MASQMQQQSNLVGLTGMARRLVSEGVVPEADVRQAVMESAQQKVALSSWLIDRNLVDSLKLTQVASAEFGMPLMDVSAVAPANLPLGLVTEALITKHQALPLFKRGKRLFVGIADPMQSHALDEIKFHSNHMVEPVLVERGQLRRVIESALNALNATVPAFDDAGLDELALEGGEGDEEMTGVDATGTDDGPVVKFVNKILVDAIKRGASDIHFEPYEANYRVRLRMDGILRPVASPPVKLGNRIASRLKVMSGLDIAERRVPQDGRIKLNLSKTRAIDFRVSTLPTLFGEKIVLRVLDGSSAKLGIDKLGYEEDQKKLYLDAIEKPYGMVLVTGPTGSGKTVSLYTALNILNIDGRNISTAEDPVEIRVEGINQVQQNVKRGMTFAAALALVPATGSGRDHGRRNPRPGNGRDRHQGGADGPHGALHPAYQRCPADHRPTDEHGHRALQHHFVGHPDHRPAPGAAPARLQEAPGPAAENAAGRRFHPGRYRRRSANLRTRGLRPLQRWLQGSRGHLPGDADDRGDPGHRA